MGITRVPRGTPAAGDSGRSHGRHSGDASWIPGLAAAPDEPARRSDTRYRWGVKGQHPICKYGFELIVQNAEPTEDTVSDCRGSLYNPEKTGDYPVVCMSHCAARAYCQWAGKKLCGAPAGGASDQASHASGEKSAWYNACTSGGKCTTAVENGVGAGKCSVLSPHGTGRKSVESESSCHSDTDPFSQVLDLGGGVVEWEDSCDASECLVRGAAHLQAGPVEGCDLLGSRGGAAETTGFRCCKPLAATP